MKKLILLFALCLGGLFYETTYAQVTIRVNIVSQPIWGPVGYDYVDYYYLPEIETYYYVPTHKYIYIQDGRWITRSYLPSRYSNYDMYRTRKVVINEPSPYLHHKEYMARYASSNERSNQQSIRDSHDSRYYENKNHPEHSQWMTDKKNNGKHEGHENGKNKQEGHKGH